ncbi:signal recognition particle receptor subunit beta-like [Oppia nitens]|uniref:signal recognition particle receptor subunit beta-like n=1 Tax=Oppia nitens TaxID=1686743 RepID=UPI0023D9F85F|nr:signal recognition particle receptor subunit beta-like [Oppia nitens]
MESLAKQLVTFYDKNYTYVAIIVAVIAVVLPILFYYIFSRKSQRNAVILVGLSDAGKTVLFSQLIAKKFVTTVTSMQQISAFLKLTNGKTIELIDIPGFERLRMKYFDDYKVRAKAVIFVIDSTDFASNGKDVADLCYNYLVDLFVSSNRIPFLMACTKQDETRAKSSKVIQKQLEREITTIRETRIGALSSTGDDDSFRAILGKPNKEFSFNDIKNPIDFIDCSAAESNTQLDSVLNWIKSIA